MQWAKHMITQFCGLDDWDKVEANIFEILDFILTPEQMASLSSSVQ